MNYSPTALASTGTAAIGLLQTSLALFIVGIAILAGLKLFPRKDKS